MPSRIRWLVAVTLVFALVSALRIDREPDDDVVVTAGDASAYDQARSGDEYVVAFGQPAGQSSEVTPDPNPEQAVDAAREVIAEAGGTILDVSPEIGVALVRARTDDFAADVAANVGVRGVAFNHAVGTSTPGMPHRLAPERPSERDRRRASADPRRGHNGENDNEDDHVAAIGELLFPAPGPEPLADLQWNMAMIGATTDQAHTETTGVGVDVGIIDTGIDARHPDIAPNFDVARSRNFTTDRPEIDGPCEVTNCVDPADVDGRGHGTHVAGVVAAARNGFGMGGVAPDARLVNLRAGQDSGYFFLYETADAIVEAGNLGLDVVNMSFYTDPWLYNCTSRDDYLAGDVTDGELDQQILARKVIGAALEYAHEQGVTLVAASGNEHTDMAAPTRADPFVPARPGEPRTRTVRRECINLPSEGPHVISVGAVGPSGTKADYSNYGIGSIALSAPGGWIRDGRGTPSYETPGNLILSAYPQAAAMAQGLADGAGAPADPFSVRWCDPITGGCGFYTYLQGTSMAAPHVVGVAALLVQREGEGTPLTGYALAPDRVAELLAQTATDRACPTGGEEIYTDEGREAAWNAACTGTTRANALYGEGIVNAAGG